MGRGPTGLNPPHWKERRTSTLTFPLGPYHPALPQPIALRLKLRGDLIVAVEPPVGGYCRRGVVALAAGGTVDDALALVERSCSLAGTSNRLALVAALEALAGIEPSRAARITRVLFAEVERILARLWTLAQAARAAGAERQERTALDQRESLFAALRQPTGQRVYWAVAIPGGTRPDFAYELDGLRDTLQTLEAQVPTWRSLAGTRGALGAAGSSVGTLNAERVGVLGLKGIIAGGAGVADDLRQSDPYGGYSDLTIDWPANATGGASDIAARLRYVVDDMATSMSITRQCLAELDGVSEPARPFSLAAASAGREVAATVEGPHGPITAVVAVTSTGNIERLRLDTPCAAVLDALPELLEGRPLAQAPLLLASVDLCPECLDL